MIFVSGAFQIVTTYIFFVLPTLRDARGFKSVPCHIYHSLISSMTWRPQVKTLPQFGLQRFDPFVRLPWKSCHFLVLVFIVEKGNRIE